jgi:hypothetical protein
MTKHKIAAQEKPPTPAQQAMEILQQLQAGVQKGGSGVVYFTAADGRDGFFSARKATTGPGYHARETCLYTISIGREGEPGFDETQWDEPPDKYKQPGWRPTGFINAIQAELQKGAKIKPPADPNEDTKIIPLDQLLK